MDKNGDAAIVSFSFHVTLLVKRRSQRSALIWNDDGRVMESWKILGAGSMQHYFIASRKLLNLHV